MIRLTHSFASAIVDSIGAARRQVMEGSHSMGELPPHLRLRRLRRMPPINLLHDPLSPSDGIGDGAHRRRNSRSAVVLCQFTSRQNRGGDQQHALPALIHLGSLALSSFVRHIVGAV